MRKAIFLDRDGVICKEKNPFFKGEPITKQEHFEWEYGSREALKELSQLENFLLVMITNQSAINRGLLSISDLHKINQPIHDELERYGRNLDGFYFCPHLPEDKCECRKPKIGMLLQAKKDLGISLEASYIIGDKTVDIKTGQDTGCKTILIETGYGGRDGLFDVQPYLRAKNLLEAVKLIKNLK